MTLFLLILCIKCRHLERKLNMKIKSVLLVGLAGIALASCDGAKSYKTQVKRETFVSDLKKAFDASSLFNVKDPYSFVEDGESTFNEKVTHTKDGRNFVEEKDDWTTTSKFEYDSVSNIIRSKSVDKRKESNNSEKVVTEKKYEQQNQADSKNYYIIDLNGKLYTKSETEVAADEIKERALMYISYPVEAFLDEYLGVAVMDDPGSKFFIDGNVYTCENIIDETEDGVHNYIQSIYQLVLFDNGFDFHYIVNRDKTELNEKLVIKSADHSHFRRKDGLNIKSIDLHNYLQVEELPSIK